MYIGHLVCMISSIFFESGLVELLLDYQSILIKVYSMFIQMVFYQGIVLMECNYFYYDLSMIIAKKI